MKKKKKPAKKKAKKGKKKGTANPFPARDRDNKLRY